MTVPCTRITLAARLRRAMGEDRERRTRGDGQPGGTPVDKTNEARRTFVKRAAYLAPAVVTFTVAPAFAKPGSIKRMAPPHGPKKP